MDANKHLTGLAMVAALAFGQSAVAQEPGEDSAYQWGRWAVLSPAAGGEPFRAPDAPGSDFNARPSDADAFQPEIASISSGGPIIGNDPRDRLPPERVLPPLPPSVGDDPRNRLPPDRVLPPL